MARYLEYLRKSRMDTDYEEVLEQLTIENPNDTRILKITATTEDAQMSKKIADEFAQVSKRSISQIMCTDEPSLIAFGYVTDEPVNVHTVKNTAVGALLGFIFKKISHKFSDIVLSFKSSTAFLIIPIGLEQ